MCERVCACVLRKNRIKSHVSCTVAHEPTLFRLEQDVCAVSVCTLAGDRSLIELAMSPSLLDCLCFGLCSPAVLPFELLLYPSSNLHILADHGPLVLMIHADVFIGYVLGCSNKESFVLTSKIPCLLNVKLVCNWHEHLVVQLLREHKYEHVSAGTVCIILQVSVIVVVVLSISCPA